MTPDFDDGAMDGECTCPALSGQPHICEKELQPNGRPTYTAHKDKGGRPKGFDGRKSKMPSAMAQKFKQCGLDWQADFAAAIKANKRDRIKLWLKLLPYLITTSAKTKGKKWKGKPSRAALIALEKLEGRDE